VPPLDPDLPVTIESVSESPRVFRIYNFFTRDESEELIEHTMKVEGLKRSTTGSGATTDKGRTSENAWDSRSPVARKMITRSFNLTGIVEDAGQIDGLQVVRYLQKQFYNSHHDYFEPGSDKDFDFNPYSGGSNRFATVFMYINDVKEGGCTVFPQATNHEPALTDLPPAHHLSLFSEHSMEYRMAKDCHKNMAVPPQQGTAALFYSITPDGRTDPKSLHGACPVIDGTKWGANIWIWNRQRFGLLRTGEKRTLNVKNECEKMVYITWEGKKNGSVNPGEVYTIGSYESHRFKAHYGWGQKAFAEFTVPTGGGEVQEWVVKDYVIPPRRKKVGGEEGPVGEEEELEETTSLRGRVKDLRTRKLNWEQERDGNKERGSDADGGDDGNGSGDDGFGDDGGGDTGIGDDGGGDTGSGSGSHHRRDREHRRNRRKNRGPSREQVRDHIVAEQLAEGALLRGGEAFLDEDDDEEL